MLNVDLGTAANPVAAVYAEDFNGEPGPMANNMYTTATGGGAITGEWYQYGNDEYATGIGLGGGAFSWGIMFPAGTYTGNAVTKVATYDVGYEMTGYVTIYNDGTTAPSNPVGTAYVELTDLDDYVVTEFPTPVMIDLLP